MKARLLEAAGGKPGHACFSGALGAALLAAALLLVPGVAWGQNVCGGTYSISTDRSITCGDQAWTQIRHAVSGSASLTIIAPGGSATTFSGTATTPSLSITASDNTVSGDYAIYVSARPPDNTGATGAVSLTSTGRAVDIDMLGSAAGTATLEVGSAVTMGSSSTRISQHGIRVRGGRDVTITNAGTIYATYEGIDVAQGGAGTLTVTHSGAIDSLNHGIWARTDGAGPMIVTNSGAVTVTNASQQGIRLEADNNGAMTLTATGGAITTPAQGIYMESRGTGAVTIQGTAASAAAGSGPSITSSASHGIHVYKSGSSATAGDVSITTTGGAITPATTGSFYGIYVQDRAGYTGSVTIDNGADITANSYGIFVSRLGSGAVSVTNSGGTVLSSASSAILAQNAASDASTVSVFITGGTVQTAGTNTAAIQAVNAGAGDVSVTIADGATTISRRHAGVFATLGEDENNNAGQIAITQGGTISARTGVLAEVSRESASGETRAAGDQPLIDVTWTGTFALGTTAQTAPNDEGRFPVIALDEDGVKRHRGVEAGDLPHRYGQAAGIEARVMDLDAVLETVAKGDDPGALMVVQAQQDLLAVPRPGESAPTDNARARADAIVSQFREMLDNEDLAVAPAVLTAIGSTATTAAELTKAEIVTYLTEDDSDRRTFLRNLLLHGLSVDEKAVLKALTTGGDLEALNEALAALPDTAAGIAWKREVRPLLNNHNVGDIRIAVNGGSIDSRGDGIRAYYVTPHDDNGGIDVTVAEGASVTGAMAGVYVANAGLDAGEDGVAGTDDDILKQSVTVNGMVTGGAHSDPEMRDAAVHLVGGGRLTVGETGVLVAGAGQPAILVNDPGRSVIVIRGEVRGSEGADAAVHLTGGGSVTVGATGRIETLGDGDVAIRGGGAEVHIEAPRDPPEQLQVWVSRESAERAAARVKGLIIGAGTTTTFHAVQDGVTTGHHAIVPLNNGRPDTSGLRRGQYPQPPPPDMPDMEEPNGEETDGERPPLPDTERRPPPPPPVRAFDCDWAKDGRCRLYEALPSFLLAVNAPQGTSGRASDGGEHRRGAWARIDVADGRWRAASSTRPDVTYDRRRHGVRAGVETGVADDVRAGVSIHRLRGVATLSGGGEAKLWGDGASIYATALADGFHLDAQAAATWYEVDLASPIHRSRPLADGVSGTGHALGVEVGRRVTAAPDVSITPRVGLAWSRVSLEGFTDSLGTRVSMERAESLSGRIGAAVEGPLGASGNGRVFAALDVMREFSTETETVVMGQTLKASAQPTSVRFGAGVSFAFGEHTSLQAAAGYETSGGGNRAFNSGAKLAIRF